MKQVLVPLDEYEILRDNATKFLTLKNYENKLKGLKAQTAFENKELENNKHKLTNVLTELSLEIRKTEKLLATKQNMLPITLRVSHRGQYLVIEREGIDFEYILNYYKNDTRFNDYIETIVKTRLKGKVSVWLSVVLCISAFCLGTIFI
jgi:hypothetical protein